MRCQLTGALMRELTKIVTMSRCPPPNRVSSLVTARPTSRPRIAMAIMISNRVKPRREPNDERLGRAAMEVSEEGGITREDMLQGVANVETCATRQGCRRLHEIAA